MTFLNYTRFYIVLFYFVLHFVSYNLEFNENRKFSYNPRLIGSFQSCLYLRNFIVIFNIFV